MLRVSSLLLSGVVLQVICLCNLAHYWGEVTPERDRSQSIEAAGVQWDLSVH